MSGNFHLNLIILTIKVSIKESGITQQYFIEPRKIK